MAMYIFAGVSMRVFFFSSSAFLLNIYLLVVRVVYTICAVHIYTSEFYVVHNVVKVKGKKRRKPVLLLYFFFRKFSYIFNTNTEK